MNKSNKKAQFAIEFVILITFMFIIFLGFFAVIGYKTSEVEESEKQQKAENIAALAENEIKLAKSSNDGYQRTFKLRKKIDGNNYNMTIIDNRELVVDYLDHQHVLFLPEKICGDTFTGVENEIKKEKGNVCLNSCWTSTQCESMDNLGLCDDVEGTFPGTKCWCCTVSGYCC